MAQADNKVLLLGALAGVAGIGLAVACYQGFKSRRRASWPAFYLNRTNEQGSGFMVVDSPGGGGHTEVLERLEALLQCVSELKDEMKALKDTLPTLQEQVKEELRGREGARRASPHYRTTPTRRKRAAAAVAGARPTGRSSEEAESEGGYMTALTDSEDELPSDVEQQDEERPADALSILLERIDRLHRGSESDKKESLEILLQQREEFGHNSSFLWRLIRAYSDLHDISTTVDEKKAHAEAGKKVGEEAVALNPTCAESHQWYAIMCGVMTEYDTMQNKIKNGYIFKDHLDKAIELKPQDPTSYYMLGRWCYSPLPVYLKIMCDDELLRITQRIRGILQVAQLSWIERKVAASLFGEPPSSTIEDALKNFLKVEELQPAYSKLNYVYLAKCYKDLAQRDKAREMCEAACSMNADSKEGEEAQKELDILCPALGL